MQYFKYQAIAIPQTNHDVYTGVYSPVENEEYIYILGFAKGTKAAGHKVELFELFSRDTNSVLVQCTMEPDCKQDILKEILKGF